MNEERAPSAGAKRPGAAAQAEEASRRHFDRWRDVYTRSRLLASLQQKALADLDLSADDRLLDVACGGGSLVCDVAPQVARAVGVDISPRMIQEARRRFTRRGFATDAPIEFQVGSSERLPFREAEFTVVLTTSALHHFPDPGASIREMTRVLAPGGRIVIGDACRDMPTSMLADALLQRFESGHVGMRRKKEIEWLLSDAGIRVTRSRFVWLGAYAFVDGIKPAEA